MSPSYREQTDSRSPKYVRWKYKLETDQTLKVTVSINWNMINHRGSFLARTRKDGRIPIPKINIDLLQNRKIDLGFQR